VLVGLFVLLNGLVLVNTCLHDPRIGPDSDAYLAYIETLSRGRLPGPRDSYQYLVESIRQFPKQTELASRIKKAGFAQVRFMNLCGGIAAIHTGTKL